MLSQEQMQYVMIGLLALVIIMLFMCIRKSEGFGTKGGDRRHEKFKELTNKEGGIISKIKGFFKGKK